ncbi:hypothetical protein B296_00029253, partial [Ensete ventricosum]
NKSKTQELGETRVCLFEYRTHFDKLLEWYIPIYTGVTIRDEEKERQVEGAAEEQRKEEGRGKKRKKWSKKKMNDE